VSVTTHHPEAEINLFVIGDAPRVVWFEMAKLMPNVSVRVQSAEMIFKALPEQLQRCAQVYEALPPGSLSARSNILRYALLYLHGGIYLDFDVLLLQRVSDLRNNQAFIGEELVWADDEKRLRGQRFTFLRPRNMLWAFHQTLLRLDSYFFAGHLRTTRALARSSHQWSKIQANNAVMGSVPTGNFVRVLLQSVSDSSVTVRYDTGPHLVDRVSRDMPNDVTRLPSQYFYEVPPGESFRLFQDQRLKLSEDSALIHYVASNHRAFVMKYSGSRYSLFRRRTVMSSELERLEAALHQVMATFLSGVHRVT
jgi:hypothetical protein